MIEFAVLLQEILPCPLFRLGVGDVTDSALPKLIIRPRSPGFRTECIPSG